MTPNGVAASNAWRNSARSIGDILVLSDIVCPRAYIGLPFCNQAFYVAASCYVKGESCSAYYRLMLTSRIATRTASSAPSNDGGLNTYRLILNPRNLG